MHACLIKPSLVNLTQLLLELPTVINLTTKFKG